MDALQQDSFRVAAKYLAMPGYILGNNVKVKCRLFTQKYNK